MTRVPTVQQTRSDPLAMTGEMETMQRRAKFGLALTTALARAGRTQREIAEAIGVSISAMSEWKRGVSEPERHDVTFSLEREIGTAPGELSIHLGYLPAEALGSWESALLSDPDIDDRLREVILAVVRSYTKGR